MAFMSISRPFENANFDRNQVTDQRFSLKQWFAADVHSGRPLRKTSSVHCYLRISEIHRKPRLAFSLLRRAVFNWLSKVITWLWLLRLVIGLKDSRQFFNQWESKPIAWCTRDFSRALSELHVIPRSCDWFMELSAPVVIGRSNCFGFGFSSLTSQVRL